MSLDFQKQWRDGVREVSALVPLLADGDLERLHRLTASMMEQKRSLQAIVAQVDAATHCAGCGGECCVAGKYHFARVDLLPYLLTGEPLFEPLFDNGLCPYLSPGGCLMAPEYRPFNCITFNCDLIEDRLPGDEVPRFYALERELRRLYQEIRALFPDNSLDGALLKGEG